MGISGLMSLDEEQVDAVFGASDIEIATVISCITIKVALGIQMDAFDELVIEEFFERNIPFMGSQIIN